MWGVLAVSRSHWVCPGSWCVCFPRPHCSGFRLLCREWALGCVHFPGLSRSGSGSQVLHKGADSVGSVFCAFPGGAAQATMYLASTLCSGAVRLITSLAVATPVSGCTCALCACVSSGELISDCNPPSGCQPSRISVSLWLETGSLFAVW